MNLIKPPAWCSNAIPTPTGWRDPDTNELLIAIRLDMSLFGEQSEEKVESKEPEEPKSNDETEVKRGPGRPKGSPNKPKPKGPGRPNGSKNKKGRIAKAIDKVMGK